MDLLEIQETLYFLSGIMTAILSAYGGMKASGRTLYPIKKIESGKARIQALTESCEIISEVEDVIGNISLEEFSDILKRAQELSTDGFTQAEAMELGSMVVKAVQKND